MKSWITLLLSFFFVSCSQYKTLDERLDYAFSLAEQKGFQSQKLKSGVFELQVFSKYSGQNETMVVYIEGDGYVWAFDHVSLNPTPQNPVALELASLDVSPSVAYIGRPCQYQKDLQAICSSSYWTSARFSPEVIASVSQALDSLKQQYQLKTFTLVGFSGGGGVAAILAASRDDVKRLITVAGNLDIDLWVKEKKLTPLAESLNPKDYAGKIPDIPQLHLIGEKDSVISNAITESFTAGLRNQENVTIKSIEGFDHAGPWQEYWKKNQSLTQP